VSDIGFPEINEDNVNDNKFTQSLYHVKQIPRAVRCACGSESTMRRAYITQSSNRITET